MDLSDVREEFNAHGALHRSDLEDNPFQQFQKWFEEAMQSGMPEPNAFSLATVNKFKVLSQRTVLLKFFDEKGFVFYTNYKSNKAQDIAEHPQVSMLFPWYLLQRQVKISGRAEKVSREMSLRYFLTRPVGSQIGAWTSPQSKVIESRDFLLLQWQKMREKFKSGQVPLPDFWGGYLIVPDKIEFWQGQPSRLHDRFLYEKDGASWRISRLAP